MPNGVIDTDDGNNQLNVAHTFTRDAHFLRGSTLECE